VTRPAMGADTAPPTVDSRGRRCPLPVIDLARAAATLPVGTTVLLLADDPAAALDIPAWCRLRGHELVDSALEPGGDGRTRRFTVRLGAGAPG
jgi:tRNA 2-thiouridine synthesizing protein A